MFLSVPTSFAYLAARFFTANPYTFVKTSDSHVKQVWGN